MDPGTQRNIRIRTTLLLLISLFFFLTMKKRPNPSPEEIRNSKYGETVIEVIPPEYVVLLNATSADPKINETKAEPAKIRIHLFKRDDDIIEDSNPKSYEQQREDDFFAKIYDSQGD
eukprot:TRINITY_DN2336_c0_g2_i1.p2 TRINITY_DN2336_c0_g2~~TRINITY_DN2336_c0_g2_i1.p2  ORF type:complete len:117 (-),score=13.98 TRINITY_DN2336_c0_g2_i1:16-366(-)